MDGAMTNQRIQTDLRDFIAAAEAGGEVTTVPGAHWDREMGAVTEVLYREKVDKAEMLVFDNGRLKQATYDTAQGFGLRAVKDEAGPNDLLARLAGDPEFPLGAGDLRDLAEPARFIGRAPRQVEEFLEELQDSGFIGGLHCTHD